MLSIASFKKKKKGRVFIDEDNSVYVFKSAKSQAIP